MRNNLIKYVSLLLLIVSLLFGCNGSSNDNNIPKLEVVLGHGYDQKAGDIFSTALTMNAVYSNGQTVEINSVIVDTYSQATEIPSKYGYSNAILGPYLLETTNADGKLDGFEYMSQSGDFIIKDNLDYYTTVDYTTENGSEEPENVYIGDEFSFHQNSTLFNSHTGSEVGYEIIDMEFSVNSEEQIEIPAGEFNAVLIGYSISETTSENNIIDTSEGTGYLWFDTTNGFLLKITANGEMTLHEYNLTASFSSERILQEYFLSTEEVSNKVSGIVTVKSLSNSNLKTGSISLPLNKMVGIIQKSYNPQIHRTAFRRR